MLQPLRDKTTQNPRSQVSQSRTLVAPTKGWYVGAPLSAAPEQTAIVLDNAFPELDFVRARAGAAPYATGMPVAPVVALMPYRSGASSKMFAVCNGSIYDVTAAGVVGAPLVTGLSTTAPFVYVQFAATGQQNLLAANGVDPVQIYNGTTWGTTPAITGLTGNPLNYLFVYQSNVWGLQAGSLNSWYLPGSAIGGPITIYPMAPIFKLGGSLVAGATWAIQTTNGIQNAIVFFTDQGEAAIFVGSTPSLPNWNLQGVYKVAAPVGQNCVLISGGDIAVMSQAGIFPISKIEQIGEEGLQNVAVTAAIQPEWVKAVQDRAGLTGWQIVDWPFRNMVIVNLPQLNSADRTQFIANARTGAWCRYTGWDARCFAIGGPNLGSLYYGTSDGRVMLAESGGQDDGKAYTSTIFPSYISLDKTDYGLPSLSQSAQRKQVKMIRPRASSNGSVTLSATINTDFSLTVPPAPPPSFSLFSGARWGVAKWGVDVWPPSFSEIAVWQSAVGFGTTISPVIQASFSSSLTPDVRLSSIDILFEAGNLLG